MIVPNMMSLDARDSYTIPLAPTSHPLRRTTKTDRRAAKRLPDASCRPQGVRVHGRVLPAGADGDGHVHLPGKSWSGGLIFVV